jgi:uncharacterized membrane protein
METRDVVMTVMQAEDVAPRVSRPGLPAELIGRDGRGGPVRLAKALGWFSLGLGLTELMAPRRLGRLIGVERGRGRTLQAFGLREILTGLGILNQARMPAWLWARTGGDLLDLAYLGSTLFGGKRNRSRVAVAAAAVLGVAMLDLLSSRQMSGRRGALRALPRKRVIEVKKTITVNRPQEEVFAFWHDFQNFPRFMSHLEAVEITGQGRSHWKAKAPAGRTVEWDAIILDDQPNSRIAWETVAGSGIDHTGTVRFQPAPGERGTEVRVELRYAPPAGRLGSTLAKLFGEEPEKQIQADLRAFKSVMETGEIARATSTDARREL